MKRIVLLATAVLMIVPDIAAAQQRGPQGDRQGSGERPGSGGPGQDGNNQGQRPGGGNQGRPGGGNQGQRPGGNQGQQPSGPRPGGLPGRPSGPQIQPTRPGPQIGRPDGNNGARPGGNNRPTRPAGYRPPPGYWNNNNWARSRVRAPRYSYPRGYSYRRWGVGLILPALFLTSIYRYNDYASLGLYAPQYGYDWIRYGPDLVLVERATGRIAEARYGVFR